MGWREYTTGIGLHGISSGALRMWNVIYYKDYRSYQNDTVFFVSL